jgi:hypothetical protein
MDETGSDYQPVSKLAVAALAAGALSAGALSALALVSPISWVIPLVAVGLAVAALAGVLADLVPPPRKHRHRYHGVFAPNHKLRRAVTALAIGNIGKRCDAAAGGHGGDGHATRGCCDANPNHKPRSHDTARIAWAKLLARLGEEFPMKYPGSTFLAHGLRDDFTSFLPLSLDCSA